MNIITAVIAMAGLGLVLIGAIIFVWVCMGAKLRFERKLREQERLVAEQMRLEGVRHVEALVNGALEKFKNVSNAALKEKGEEFRALNAGELDHILKPLRESVAKYEESARKSQEKTDRLEIKMCEHMNALGTAAEKFNSGSTNFVNAMTGGNKVAGNWGETVLGQLLDDCELVKDVHYVAQTGESGKIPDYQVFDASSRKILVIDSKVSWKKYKEMSDSNDPSVREAALKEHIESVRQQIDKLAGKNYQKTLTPPKPGFEYLPFAAMFVPSDAALWEAVKRDPSLPAYAYRKNVVLVTPTSLFGFMKLIREGWSLYNTQKNQEEIAHQANLLIERIDKLFVHLEAAEKAYDTARDQLKKAKDLAVDGGQCIKGPAIKIIKLHAKSDKALKSHAIGDSVTSNESGD